VTRKVVAPVIEIVEVRKQLPLGDGVEWVMVPNDVRINGVSLLCSDDPSWSSGSPRRPTTQFA
jgi:hypothetical protein